MTKTVVPITVKTTSEVAGRLDRAVERVRAAAGSSGIRVSRHGLAARALVAGLGAVESEVDRILGEAAGED
mgnify:CR=1 FL=1